MSNRAQALAATLIEDVGKLRSAYAKAGLIGPEPPNSSAVRMLGGSGQSAQRFRRDFLLFEAAVRIRLGRRGAGNGLKHVVVFGGNNVGKSTVINILAADAVVNVSPEGGYTQHPTAVAAVQPPLFEAASQAFSRFELVSGQPPTGRFDCYVVNRMTSSVLPRDVVLWDTPDCDAVGSSRYLEGLVEAVAAADQLLYVTSIERYAVANIVEWIVELNALGISIVECLNKTPRRHRQLVIDKQRNEIFPKMAREAGQPVPQPPIVALQNLQDGEEEDLWGPGHPEAEQLRNVVLSEVTAADRDGVARAALAYAIARVDRVLMPARLELKAREMWQQEVTQAVASFVTTYEKHYLQSDTVIEPFKRLNLEILNLIDPDIPGLKLALVGVRKMMRWKWELIRKAYALLKDRTAPDGQVPPQAQAFSIAHAEVLSAVNSLINRMRMNGLYHPFWDAVAGVWDDQVRTLTSNFDTAVQMLNANTERQIKEAAEDVFHSLKQRPNLLKGLRLAKVSSDVAGVVAGVVVPMHGHMVYDLFEHTVITPLLVGYVEKGAEVAIAAYVEQRRRSVVEALRQEARDTAGRIYLQPLQTVGEKALEAAGKIGIADELLTRLPNTLRQLSDSLENIPA